MLISPRTVTATAILLLAAAGCGGDSHAANGTVESSSNQPHPVQRIGSIKHLLAPGGYLDGLTVSNGDLWAADLDGNRVVRVEVKNLHRLPDIAVPDGPLSVEAVRGAVWVASYQGRTVTRIDARTGHQTASVTTPSSAPCGLAASGDRLWVFDQSDGRGVLLDASTGTVLRKAKSTAHSGLAGWLFGSVWVTDFAGTSGTVQRLDPRSGTSIATIKTGDGPISVASGAGSLWVANAKANTVSRIDPATNAVVATIPISGGGPTDVLVTHGYAWVTSYTGNALYRVDLSTNTVDGRLALPGPAQNLALAGGLLWVTVSSGQLAGIDLHY